jgi:hypothetical protein
MWTPSAKRRQRRGKTPLLPDQAWAPSRHRQNQAVSSQIALAPEAAPFGLATERVYDGEILCKWT